MDNHSPSASVITVTHNSRTDLVESGGHARDVEWIVVDNASSDDSAEVARAQGASVVRSPSNLGFSAANNLGAGAATGEVLIFCNPDVKTSAEGIRDLARTTWERGGIVAPQLVNPDGSVQENGRGMPFPHRKVRHFLQRDVDLATDRYVRHAAPGELVETVWATGAVIAIRADQFDAIGGWNEKFFLYCEDIDICLRARRAGLPVYLDGSVRWEHRWDRAGRKSFSWRIWRHELRSNALLYLLHPYCLAPLGVRARRLRAIEAESAVAVS